MPHTGLTSMQAAARLAAEGRNELPREGRRQLPRILRDVLSEPMFALLLGAGVIYLVLGDRLEALVLLAFASLSVTIAVIQETRSERVLDALSDLTSPRALVIRDGAQRRIAGTEVVRGDLILLSEGDRVPADGTLIEARELMIDESLLTGESAPVRKQAVPAAEAAGQPGGDDQPYVFSGTLVVRGQGLAEVHAIGPHSEIGRIGRALGQIETAPAHLSRQTARLVRIAASGGLLCCLLVIVLYGLLRGSWLNGVLAGIALGMAMLPEEFPLVLTVFMVMGAWRMSKARVLTRRAAAIESLGEATVLCTDKTGTLTENRMSVIALVVGGERLDPRGDAALPPEFRRLAMTGAMASTPDAYDPMDRAFQTLVARAQGLPSAWSLQRVYGVQPDLLALTQVWQDPATGQVCVAAKGAPEAIADLCGLGRAARDTLTTEADRLAAAGMRVLAIAEAAATKDSLPETPRGFAFRLLGLAGLADPLRASVPAAIRECQAACIRVVMITGDYPITARAIARQAGLPHDAVLDGPAIAGMSDDALAAAIENVSVFARIVPAQKLRIVEAFKARGEVVAMTGDGVNDAPSLKAANIGIAMGGRGTDVAREASSLVLLDDDFGSIVATIRLGRRIYDNLRKAMAYIIAVHVPIAGLALLPLLTGLPLIFSPIHVAFLEMVIDPVCSVVFEAEPAERDIMRRPPRAATTPLFSPALLVWSLLQGAVVLLFLAALYMLAIRQGLPEQDARALTFVSLVILNLALVLVNRSYATSFRALLGQANRALVWVASFTLAVIAVTLILPAGRALFRFGPLHPDDLTLVAVIVLAVVVLLHGLKRFWRASIIS